MKKLNICLAGCIALLTLMTSCKDFLEELPRGIVIAKTTSDFRALLDNVGNQRFAYSFSQVSSAVDVVSDDVQVDSTRWLSWNNRNDFLNRLYAFETDVWNNSPITDDVNWKNQFHIVSLAGTLLIELEKVTDNPELKRQLISEARVHRAYAYFHLVNIYAKHYNKATASTDLGVPMYENAASLPSLERRSVEEVYQYVIKELETSYEDLPESSPPKFVHRPSRLAVDAILARVYLYMGEYEKSLTHVNRVLDKHDDLWDYNTRYTGTDRITNLIGISRLNDIETILHKSTAKGSQRVQNYYLLDTATFNQVFSDYERTSSGVYNNIDLRRSLWFNGFAANFTMTGRSMTFNRIRSTWYKLDGSHTNAVDYLDIGTPEMLLIRAECLARDNKLTEALADVNRLRQHRLKSAYYIPKTVTTVGGTQAAVIDFVLQERRRELYGKELRLFDIKRLQLPVRHSLNSRIIEVEANSPRLVWPIFDGYIELNPEIVQNPR